MQIALSQFFRPFLSLAFILPLVLGITASPLMASDQIHKNSEDNFTGAGVVVVAAGHGDRDRDDRPPSTRERMFIPLTVLSGTLGALCVLISAGWIIEHYVGGSCPDQPGTNNNSFACPNFTDLFNTTMCPLVQHACNNFSNVCPNITDLLNLDKECFFMEDLCGNITGI